MADNREHINEKGSQLQGGTPKISMYHSVVKECPLLPKVCCNDCPPWSKISMGDGLTTCGHFEKPAPSAVQVALCKGM